MWAYKPLIYFVLDLGDLERFPSDELEGFTDALLSLVPTLWEHKCSVGQAGGFVSRLRRGTWMGHIVEHVALELQTLAGSPVKFGKTRATDESGVYNLVFEFVEEAVGIAAGRLAVDLVASLAEGRRFELAPRLLELAKSVQKLSYGSSTRVILDEARRRGVPSIRLNDASLVQLGYGRWQQRIQATKTSHTRMIAVDVASDRALTHRLLEDIGIPVPAWGIAHCVDEAVEVAQSLGYPLVVKPLDATVPGAVTLRINDVEGLRRAVEVARTHSRKVIVERFVEGRKYRLLVVDGQVVAVAECLGPHVTGDGKRSVRALVEALSAVPVQGFGRCMPPIALEVDDETRRVLDAQGLTPDSVPPLAARVLLKETSDPLMGGTVVDRTDEALFENLVMACRAARVVGLDVAGVDVITADIAQPVAGGGGGVVGVSAAPDFQMHVSPSEGQARDVAGPVLDMLFPPGTPARIPLISITGTNGKTTTTRMCAHILKMAGHRVGFTTTDGIYIDGSLIREGDMTGPWSARMVLKDATIDCAVLETARGGILRSGLGFDRCNIGAVLNVSDDHLGIGGIHTIDELAHVKSLVIEVVASDGWGVLNAEDERCVAMAEKCDGKTAYFSFQPSNERFRRHVESGGRGATLEGWRGGAGPTRQRPQTVVLYADRKRIPLADASEIPATYGGTSLANVKNALAAALICHLAGVSVDNIRQGLLTFDASYHLAPGRMNLLDVRDFRVLLDYAHNIAALDEMASFVKVFNKRRSIGVLACAGDRQDYFLQHLGEQAGAIFDIVIIKEDDDRRGREVGEAAALLAQGVRKGRAALGRSCPEGTCRVVLSEVEAVQSALEMGGQDDLVVILGDNLKRCWEQIARFRTSSGQ